MAIRLQKKDVITKQQWPLTLYVCWGQNFHATWLYFIDNQYHINIIKSISNPKRAHIQNDAKAHGLKPMAYYFIKAHGLSSWHIILFSAYDPSSWISLGEFWESWFGGPRSMFSKVSVVQSWQRKHVAWRVFPNSLNSDKLVCNW